MLSPSVGKNLPFQILATLLLSFTLLGTGGAATVVFTVNDTETVVTGLTPGADYTFSVTAENAVSSQDMNIFIRTVNITATTKEGGEYACTCTFLDMVNAPWHARI